MLMAVEITEDNLRLAVLRLAELTKEKQFVLVGRGTLAVTAPPDRRFMARSEDIDLWPQFNETAALDESRELYGEGSTFGNMGSTSSESEIGQSCPSLSAGKTEPPDSTMEKYPYSS